jgi:hypothetical protein
VEGHFIEIEGRLMPALEPSIETQGFFSENASPFFEETSSLREVKVSSIAAARSMVETKAWVVEEKASIAPTAVAVTSIEASSIETR